MTKGVKGIEYFPHLAKRKKEIEVMLAKYKGNAYFVYYLLEEIYEVGYYLKVDDDTLTIYASRFGITLDLAKEIILTLVDKKKFDEKFYKENVLTSVDIQEEYFKITHKRKFELNAENEKFLLVNPNDYRTDFDGKLEVKKRFKQDSKKPKKPITSEEEKTASDIPKINKEVKLNKIIGCHLKPPKLNKDNDCINLGCEKFKSKVCSLTFKNDSTRTAEVLGYNWLKEEEPPDKFTEEDLNVENILADFETLQLNSRFKKRQ